MEYFTFLFIDVSLRVVLLSLVLCTFLMLVIAFLLCHAVPVITKDK